LAAASGAAGISVSDSSVRGAIQGGLAVGGQMPPLCKEGGFGIAGQDRLGLRKQRNIVLCKEAHEYEGHADEPGGQRLLIVQRFCIADLQNAEPARVRVATEEAVDLTNIDGVETGGDAGVGPRLAGAPFALQYLLAHRIGILLWVGTPLPLWASVGRRWETSWAAGGRPPGCPRSVLTGRASGRPQPHAPPRPDARLNSHPALLRQQLGDFALTPARAGLVVDCRGRG